MFINPKEVVSNLALSDGMVVGDFGIGTGAFSEEMSKQVGPEGLVYAVDVQEPVLKRTQQHFLELGISNVEFIHGNLEDVGGSKIADRTLDLVLLSNIFFQVDDDKDLAREALRTVKVGGRIVVIDWKGPFAGLGPSADLVFTEEKAIKTFSDLAGAEIVSRLEKVGNYHYGIIFRKK